MRTVTLWPHPPPNVPQQTASDNTDPTDASSLVSHSFFRTRDQEEQFPEDFNPNPGGSPEQRGAEEWEGENPVAAHTAVTRSHTRSYIARMTRQKSRRRGLLGRQAKPGITVDTSFTTHRGNTPHLVYPHGDRRSVGSIRKSPWFGLGRSSTRNKGLGITKGTPHPESKHGEQPDADGDKTAVSLTSSGRPWQDISPRDRRIPIGISVPTDSISDFSSYQTTRPRAGSNVTPVTPTIIITPAAPMQSAWSPDTPFTESEYTPSVYSHHQFHSSNADVPPVPSLPIGLSVSSEEDAVSADSSLEPDTTYKHARNDTLDSAGTAFDHVEKSKKKDRIMSSETVFEEDETPLRKRTIETSLAIDTSAVPTPRRSQGWWNIITTPFVTTPNIGTWRSGDRTPDVPTVPIRFGPNEDAPSVTNASPTLSSPSAPATISNEAEQKHTIPSNDIRVQKVAVSAANTTITSPFSERSATPILGTAALGTVLVPRQVDDEPRRMNINIELQDRRPIINHQSVSTNRQPATQYIATSTPAPQSNTVATEKTHRSPQMLPVFAPPPTGSHFSYDNFSRSSSLASPRKPPNVKRHRKVCNVANMLPFRKRRNAGQRSQEEKKKKKRGVCFWGCCCCLLILVLLAIIIPVVVIVLRKHNDKPSTSTAPSPDGGNQWLSPANYPPIPTGILTVAQPEAVEEESGCVAPTTLWSCALPKELQASVAPNKPNQPNLRFEITFENGTSAQLPASTRVKRKMNPVSAGALIRARLLQLRAGPSPSPAPPSNADMRFLGQTTDGNSAPFEGEATPLFMSFLDATSGSSRLARRGNPNDPTNITAVIPPPMLDSDGTAAPANLLPNPTRQPLRLYNRGKDSEYYGFYTYFDRSIFLKQINGTNRGGNPADTDGGSARDAAKLRCTYAQSRFMVQIWTRSNTSKPLLQSSASNHSATFKRPGTFPYPVSFTVDRHGGDASKKNLYCYEMEDNGTIKNDASKRSFQFEDRAFGGNLVNGTQGRTSVTGPIDGGTGGCRCQWQNWLT